MSIQVKFFASLRDLMGDDQELSWQEIQDNRLHTIDDLWHYCSGGKARPDNVLIAQNMNYVDAHSPLEEGDEIAFFPPVTGG